MQQYTRFLRLFGASAAELTPLLKAAAAQGCPGLRLLQKDGECVICISAPGQDNRAVLLTDRWADQIREKLGPEFVNVLNEMLVFDAVICNTDRHFGNFGVLVDNRTNAITSPAPLFDHGNSLFNFAGTDAWADSTALEEYIETLYPSVYDDFLGTAKSVLTPELREKLRHLLTFHFKKHSRYNLPPKRLRMIEKQIQKRAGILLEH